MVSILRRSISLCLGIAGGACLTVPAWSADNADPDSLDAAQKLAVSHCSPCHTFGEGEPHGQGLSLFGLIGREAGTIPGFRFSEGYQEAMQGKVWDAELLDRWLADTLAVAPKTTMVYWQDDPATRATLIRFFESLR